MYTLQHKQLGEGAIEWIQSNLAISKKPGGPLSVTIGQQNVPPPPPPVTVLPQIQQKEQNDAIGGSTLVLVAIGLGAMMMMRR